MKYFHIISAIPTVTVSSSTITVDEGENVTCSCTSDGGNPPANVVWTKNGKKFGETEQRENILFLRNVSTSDAGNYVCTAESYPDNKYRDAKSVQLILNCKYRNNICVHNYFSLAINNDRFSKSLMITPCINVTEVFFVQELFIIFTDCM